MVIKDDFITPNIYTRPGGLLNPINGIVVHWTGVPKQKAEMVRKYFDHFAPKEKKAVSAHYIIDFDGTVYHIIPDTEIAYHVSSSTVPDDILQKYGYPNYSMIGIECCVQDSRGHMTFDTSDALLNLVTMLMARSRLYVDSLFRHYDLTTTQKDCHKYYVDNPGEWENFKFTVACNLGNMMGGNYYG